jgi:hypothetical protein
MTLPDSKRFGSRQSIFCSAEMRSRPEFNRFLREKQIRPEDVDDETKGRNILMNYVVWLSNNPVAAPVFEPGCNPMAVIAGLLARRRGMSG